MNTPKASQKRSYRDMSAIKFIALVTLLNIVLFHFPLWSYVSSNIDFTTFYGASVIFSIIVIIILFTVVISLVIALFSSTVLKYFWMLAFLINSAATYYLVTYQLNLSRSMMGNIINTRTDEAFDLFHPMLLVYICFLGLIPAFIIYKIKLKKISKLSCIAYFFSVLITGSFLVYINSSSWLWIDKHAKNLGGRIVPWSYIFNTVSHYKDKNKGSVKQQLLPNAFFKDNNKMVVLLVIGETARAQNFSLYGYEKQTNPLLEKHEVITLKNTQSCSTYTTASVACILSHTGSTSASYEPLPSYLKRHDADVIWRTKNWGEPHINVTDYSEAKDLLKDCQGAGCQQDELLLTGLLDRIKASNKKKIFVVLHTKGSHGPSYYTRYTKRFEVFKPVCKSVELNNCSEEALKNAYDNSILYTDYFLTQTITLLKGLEDIPSTMLYISDHGESLGEFGLYLHGTPYAVAPDFQKKVPFIVWMSKSFKAIKSIQNNDIAVNKTHSQANIFHSVLGAFSMESDIYNKNEDIFNP